MTDAELDQLAINTIRTLSIDAVQTANTGHPGTPMALAPLVYTLWNRVMRFDARDAIWPDRDRFLLSNGHASMLLWSMVCLTATRAVNAEYETLGRPADTLDDVRRFRQLGSHAPRHPEYHLVSGEMQRREIPAGWDRNLPVFPPDSVGIAGRVASGGELSLAADAHERRRSEGIRSRVVSMPTWDVFEREPQGVRVCCRITS